jgi:hypothetical protein
MSQMEHFEKQSHLLSLGDGDPLSSFSLKDQIIFLSQHIVILYQMTFIVSKNDIKLSKIVYHP